MPLKDIIADGYVWQQKRNQWGKLVSTDTSEKNTTPCGSKRIRGPKLENFGVRSNWVGPQVSSTGFRRRILRLKNKNTIKKIFQIAHAIQRFRLLKLNQNKSIHVIKVKIGPC